MPFDAVSALNYGVTGLGFLLAFLSYRLLTDLFTAGTGKETPIYVFMAFSFLLVITGLVSEYIKSNISYKTMYDSQSKKINIFTADAANLFDDSADGIFLYVTQCQSYSTYSSKSNDNECQKNGAAGLRSSNNALVKLTALKTKISNLLQ